MFAMVAVAVADIEVALAAAEVRVADTAPVAAEHTIVAA